MIFQLDRVSFRYPNAETDAVQGVDLHVGAGESVGIVGPNGSGKTTLLRMMLGKARHTQGAVQLLDRPIHEWDRRALARTVGVVSQREEPVFPLRVREAVFLGRYPHMRAFGAPTPADHRAVDAALERCDITDLATRWVSTLSGGEWQRVRVARALAQAPTALVLDEATANLDIRHEMEVFELVLALVRQEGLAAVFVTHHVNLAARFADRVVVMHGGRARAVGPPGEVLTQAIVESVFEWPVEVAMWRGVPQVVPLRGSERKEGSVGDSPSSGTRS